MFPFKEKKHHHIPLPTVELIAFQTQNQSLKFQLFVAITRNPTHYSIYINELHIWIWDLISTE